MSDGPSPATTITIIGGKGGVGKTTIAAATGLGFADAGLRTLVASTDPAHSLSDAFECPLRDTPRQVTAGLWAVEPETDTAVASRIAQVTEDARAALPREVMPAVQRHLSAAANAPGMAESALCDLLIGYLELVPSRWDRLVVDSAATGHLIRMLELPSLLTPWVDGLAQQRERSLTADPYAAGILDEPAADPLLDRLNARRQRLAAAAARLREEARVHLVFVARRVVLAETLRAAATLTASGFRLGPSVLNHALSTSDPADGVPEELAVAGLARVQDSEDEPTGPARLRELSAVLEAQDFPGTNRMCG